MCRGTIDVLLNCVWRHAPYDRPVAARRAHRAGQTQALSFSTLVLHF
jgi:hypothetical protein